MKNRFYCGAPNYTQIAGSLDDAIEEAREKLRGDLSRDVVTIVEIVRVVRRATPNPPIVVEKVTG